MKGESREGIAIFTRKGYYVDRVDDKAEQVSSRKFISSGFIFVHPFALLGFVSVCHSCALASGMEEKAVERPKGGVASYDQNPETEVPINASGHKQELERNFSLLHVCALAITSGNTWISLGGSVTVAIYNGGPPGVIYEL